MFMPGFDFYEVKKSIKISKKHLTSYVNAPLVLGVQGVKSLGGHFACLCWEFNFYEVKEK